MAGILARVNSGEILVPAGGTKTILQLKTAINHRAKILGFSVSFKGVASNEKPFKVELIRQTTAGIGSPVLPQKNNISDSEVLQTSAAIGIFSPEPTPGAILFSTEVHPQGGYQVIYPFGQEIILPGAGTGGSVYYYLAIRVVSDAANSITPCVAQFDFEE